MLKKINNLVQKDDLFLNQNYKIYERIGEGNIACSRYGSGKIFISQGAKGETDNSKAGAAAANAASKNYEYANQKPGPKFATYEWKKLDPSKQKQLQLFIIQCATRTQCHPVFTTGSTLQTLNFKFVPR